MTVRIGSVPYLNSKVLIHGLEPRGTASDGTPYTLELLPPSPLAQKLAAGALDVALVSSVEYFRHPEYTLLPGLGVCGHAEMWSIRLFHRVPLPRLERVGLDPASETTNALLRVILEERHGLKPAYVPLECTANPLERTDLDGFLRIGDPCLRLMQGVPGCAALDLQAEWRALTGLPFVYAAWLVRGGADLRGIPGLLAGAKEKGLKKIDAIASAYHAEAGLDITQARVYAERIVGYAVGPEETSGLMAFQQRLIKLGLLQRERPLELYQA